MRGTMEENDEDEEFEDDFIDDFELDE